MEKLRLMTIIGTRPEIIRLSEVIKKCDIYFDQTLVHTGQNWDYELNQIFFEDLGLREPDCYLDAVGSNLGETIGNIISKSYKAMLEVRPDALLILGDTNSCLSAISAKRLHIPIFHMEAGNRCFDECLPEETNRRIVDHIADVNMCYSEHARRYLNHEGTAKERTFVTGSPMAEVLSENLEKIKRSQVLKELGAEPGKYILLSAHREENIDNEENFLALMNAVNAMAKTYQMPVIYSTHPRSRKFIDKRGFQFHPLVRSLQPFGFSDYNHLQIHAFCVVSDSGTLPEESSYFNSQGMPFPAVCVRTSTERPEAIDKGNFVIGSITEEQVLQAVDMAVMLQQNGDFGTDVPDYMDRNVSTKVVKIIQSYTGIVNKMVWRKTDLH
ncbi:MAG: UDP-N-acetyl glucosamine 2-epimerase [Lachnospiraceae bacterium]|nr:UDP-N-acetyl glucosamine 2-epimerase [Lachnospiraceae bacterium]